MCAVRLIWICFIFVEGWCNGAVSASQGHCVYTPQLKFTKHASNFTQMKLNEILFIRIWLMGPVRNHRRQNFNWTDFLCAQHFVIRSSCWPIFNISISYRAICVLAQQLVACATHIEFPTKTNESSESNQLQSNSVNLILNRFLLSSRLYRYSHSMTEIHMYVHTRIRQCQHGNIQLSNERWMLCIVVPKES